MSTYTACGIEVGSDEVVTLSFEHNSFVFARVDLCSDCEPELRWLCLPDDNSVEVELDGDAQRFGRWESVGSCGARPEPCIDIRPCPNHIRGIVN